MPDGCLCIFLPAHVLTFHTLAPLPGAVASDLGTKDVCAKNRSSFRQRSSDESKSRPFLCENRDARRCLARSAIRNRFGLAVRYIFWRLRRFALQQECQ